MVGLSLVINSSLVADVLLSNGALLARAPQRHVPRRCLLPGQELGSNSLLHGLRRHVHICHLLSHRLQPGTREVPFVPDGSDPNSLVCHLLRSVPPVPRGFSALMYWIFTVGCGWNGGWCILSYWALGWDKQVVG